MKATLVRFVDERLAACFLSEHPFCPFMGCGIFREELVGLS